MRDVVAALPNYNMGRILGDSVAGALSNGYDRVVVLDDNSSDDSRDVLEDNFAAEERVLWVSGDENVGAGGNRNRIFEAIGLAENPLVHFMDVDVELIQPNSAQLVRDAAERQPAAFGFIGGLILETTNEGSNPFPWNYGPRKCAHYAEGVTLHASILRLMRTDPEIALQMRRDNEEYLQHWPDPFMELVPEPRQVFWAAEGNLVVDYQIFRRFGGFDGRMRAHEIQELAIRMKDQEDLPRYFDPSFPVQIVSHPDVRGDRTTEQLEAEEYILEKHGANNWYVPGGDAKPEL